MLPDIDEARFLWKHSGVLHLGKIADLVLESMVTEFEQSVLQKANKGLVRNFARNALMVSKTFQKLIVREEFSNWLNAVLEARVEPVAGDATRYIGATYWHCDVIGGRLPLAKIAVYLDPPPPLTASFHYIPGSHTQEFTESRMDLITVLRSLNEGVAWSKGLPCIHFSAGDFLLFSPRLLHAVHEQNERRQLATIFSAKPTSPEERIELLQLMLSNGAVL